MKTISKHPRWYIVATILTLLILSSLAMAFLWTHPTSAPVNQIVGKNNQTTAKSEQSAEQIKAKDACVDGDIQATSGTFCSTDLGIKLALPTLFEKKLAKIDNYSVQTTSEDNQNSSAFGTSSQTYGATIKYDTHSAESYELIVSSEPIRDFRVRSLKPYFFSASEKRVYSPDSKENAPTVTIDGRTFYHYGIGDIGTLSQVYLLPRESDLLVISLTSSQNPMENNHVVNSDELLKEFETKIKSLRFV